MEPIGQSYTNTNSDIIYVIRNSRLWILIISTELLLCVSLFKYCTRTYTKGSTFTFRFFFDLNETGDVVAVRDSDYNVVDEIASYNDFDSTLSLQTNSLTIYVVGYTGYYTLGGYTADFSRPNEAV